VPPRALQPKVPRDLETICLKCLEKAPARRYPSAEALADDLRRFENGEPVRARPVTAIERAVKWARRRPAVATLLALVALITTLGVAGISWEWWRAEDRAVAAEAAEGRANEKAAAEQAANEKTRAALGREADARHEEQIQREKAVAELERAEVNLHYSR